ncbi:hybrid sensor histidine kinase/response regulator [Acanthopleuribacter pedis]|uniref:histidine kinase n=1 Tax=Acanthopleuribacter pedis TaxID=442870 RepID=A0A8J7QTV2_9BACT|nr:response regulator [Acanthopleuribacter pedis]MBO1323288.1 response regulator [Acanthopleuribacter pedis]
MPVDPSREVSLLGLFKQEVAVQAQLMSLALTNLQISGPNPGNMEMLRTSAHAVKGASRIVNLIPMSQTAGALEKLFERDRERNRPYEGGQMAKFAQAVEHIHQISQVDEQAVARAGAAMAETFEALTAAIERMPAENQDSPNLSPAWVTRVENDAFAKKPSVQEPALAEPETASAPQEPEDLKALADQLGLILPEDDGIDESDPFDEAELAKMPAQPRRPPPPEETEPETDEAMLAKMAAETGIILPGAETTPSAPEPEPDPEDLAAWAARTGIVLPEDEKSDLADTGLMSFPARAPAEPVPDPEPDAAELEAMAAAAGIILPDENAFTPPADLLSYPAQSGMPVDPTRFDPTELNPDPTPDDLAKMAAEAGIILPDSDPAPPETAVPNLPGETYGVPHTGNYFDWSDPEDPPATTGPSRAPTEQESMPGFHPADLSMLDLFRTEAETHTTTLVNGLLALERRPEELDAIHELMRAAHSLKVAASIVQFPLLVDLAHGMEDKLVAAQKGALRLNSDIIDLLLGGVDVFTKIIEEPDDRLQDWFQREQSRIGAMTERLRGSKPALASPDEAPGLAAPEPGSGDRPVRPSGSGVGEDEGGAANRDTRRHVRISAEKLDRLMAVSSQFFVATRGLDKFSSLLYDLKQRQLKLNDQLQRLEANLGPQKLNPHTAHTLREARRQLSETNHAFADSLPNFTQSTSQLIQLSNQLHHTVISSRMTPFGEGVQSIPRMVRDLARLVGKKVHLEIRGSDTEADRDIIEKLLPPLKHLVRNALDHGIETPEERRAAGKDEEALLLIDAHHQAGMLTIMVEDDGRGVNYPKLRQKVVDTGLANPALAGRLSEKELLDFLFLPGFSTAKKVSSISGRGVGLDVVYSMVHEIGGSLRASSQPGRFMRIQLNVPVTLSVVRTLILEIEGQPYAVPLAKIRYCSSIESDRIYNQKGRLFMRWNDENVGLVDARQVLGLPEQSELPKNVQIVFFQLPDRTLGLIVDRFLGHRHLVVRPIDDRIGDIPDINAAAIMEDGRVVLIFHADDLMQSIERCLEGQLPAWQQRPRLRRSQSREKLRILVVDDSATVREVQRQILQEQGFQVDLAEDGVLGLKALGKQTYDLIISDVDMPRMNGLKFIQKIRANPQLSHLPVLMVSYRDSDGDRTRGLDAGADAYLTKNDLYATTFIETVQDLLDKVATRH